MARIYSVCITEERDVRSFEYEVEDSYPIVVVKDLKDMKSLVLDSYKKNKQNHDLSIWYFKDKEMATCFLVACKYSLSRWITEYEMSRFCRGIKSMESMFA